MRPAENLLLGNLSPADGALLAPHLRDVALKLGQVLCGEHQEITSIYFPRSGVVSLLSILRDGSEVECCTMGHETAFGLMAAQEPARSFTRDIVQIAGAGSMIKAREFRTACAGSLSLQTVVHRHLRASASFMAQSVACNARHRLDARLCRWLLTCGDYVEGDVVPLTQEFIGAMLGVHRTTVTDAIAFLQADGLVSVLRGKVTIHDRLELMKRSCECYSTTRAAIDATLPG